MTQFWNITGSSSGHRAMHPARSPPGQLGFAVLLWVVVVWVVGVVFSVVWVVFSVVVVFCVVVVVVVVVVVGASARKLM